MTKEKKSLLEELQSRLLDVLQNSPAKDIEKNVRALLTQAFSKLDLITREEHDLHSTQITLLQEKCDQLEKRLATLEAKSSAAKDSSNAA